MVRAPGHNASPAGRPRSLQLDVLRGVAILLVLGSHPAVESSAAGSLAVLARPWQSFGWTGVDLFFVLSGYLIGGLLIAELGSHGGIDVRRFLVRRSFKIWPCYYVYLIIAADLMLGRKGFNSEAARQVGSDLLPNLFHLQNYLGTPLGHTWSLAVEEHFYLALPLLLALIARNPAGGASPLPRALPAITVAVCLACLGCRLHDVGGSTPLWLLRHRSHLRIDSLLFGVLLAYLRFNRPEFWRRLASRPLALSTAGMVALAPMLVLGRDDQGPFVMTVGYTLLYFGYGLILTAMTSVPMPLSLPTRALSFVGRHSYPIYLCHIDLARDPVQWAVRSIAWGGARELIWLTTMAAYLAAATLVGVLLGSLVEAPALALRDRLFPSRLTESPGLVIASTTEKGALGVGLP